MSVPATAAKPPPARGWYGLSAILILAAVAIVAVFIIYRIHAITGMLQQVVVPGQATLTLDEPGDYTIFHEYESVVDGKLYYAMSLSGLNVTVTGPDGARVTLTTPGATSRYNLSSRSGVSVFAFTATKPGAYRLVAAYDNGRNEPQTVLAVGKGFLASILLTVFGALLIMFAGIGGGAAIAVIVFIKRRRAQRVAPTA